MLLSTFDPFLTDFDRMVHRTFGRGDWAQSRSVLPMDVIRREDQVELRLDLPGADPDSIEVTTDRGVLAVSASRNQYAESDKPVVRERYLGSFTRRVRLSDTVDAERIEASYDNGVLSIVLPLAEKAKPRKIEIKGAPVKGELAV
jgi:HSP20 family protein